MSNTIRFTINPNELRGGASLGVSFRTGAHDRRKNNPKRDRRDFKQAKNQW